MSINESPPRHNRTKEWRHKDYGPGEIYSFSTTYEPKYIPGGYPSPLTIAIIRLESGEFITAQLTDPDPGEAFYIEMLVECVTRKGYDSPPGQLIVYLPKFRPKLKVG